MQICEAQSAGTPQPWPPPQGGQLPPQSTPVSSPFLCPSAQLGSAQTPLAHVPEAQSAPPEHPPPFAHGSQVGPPQSVPVSSPFFT